MGLIDRVLAHIVTDARTVVEGNRSAARVAEGVGLHHHRVGGAQTHRVLGGTDVVARGLHIGAGALKREPVADLGNRIGGDGAALIRTKTDSQAIDGVDAIALNGKCGCGPGSVLCVNRRTLG